MIGTVVGNYRIERFLGGGGMGSVYLATDVVLGREVAIKVLNRGLLQDETKLQAFRDEAKTQARLNHPNVATLYNLLELNGEYFMVMEFVDGETLDNLLLREGALPLPRALSLFQQALQGFEHAHQRHIIHRDIKPGNLIVTGEGQVKITDFGIARVLGTERKTKAGWFKGTYEYASPEQIRGQEQDERSDVYSLGVLFYQMVTGQLPFSSTSEFEIMRAHMEEPPRPVRILMPTLPPALEKIIETALAKSPSQRFANVREFREALHTLAPLAAIPGNVAGERAPAPPQTRAVSSPQPAQRAAGSAEPYATRVGSIAAPPPMAALLPGAALPPVSAPLNATASPPAVAPLNATALPKVSPRAKSFGAGGVALGACLVVGLGIGVRIVQGGGASNTPTVSSTLPAHAPATAAQTPAALAPQPAIRVPEPEVTPPAASASAPEKALPTPAPSQPVNPPAAPVTTPPPTFHASLPPPVKAPPQAKISKPAKPVKIVKTVKPIHHPVTKTIVHHPEPTHSRPSHNSSSRVAHGGTGGSSRPSHKPVSHKSADERLRDAIKHDIGN